MVSIRSIGSIEKTRPHFRAFRRFQPAGFGVASSGSTPLKEGFERGSHLVGCLDRAEIRRISRFDLDQVHHLLHEVHIGKFQRRGQHRAVPREGGGPVLHSPRCGRGAKKSAAQTPEPLWILDSGQFHRESHVTPSRDVSSRTVLRNFD